MKMLAINPMYYGTLGFLMFSGMLLSVGLWAIHGMKKERAQKRPIGFTAGPESRSRSAG
jgi:hypothetical protein